MNSAVPWIVHVDRTVERQLRRFPKRDGERVYSVITEMAANPYAGDIVMMRGEEGGWRRRVGAYRIFFEILRRGLYTSIAWSVGLPPRIDLR